MRKIGDGKVIKFKFKFVDDDGNETGFLSKKATFDGTTLVLDGNEMPVEAILRAVRRSNRIVLQVLQEDGTSVPVVLAIRSGKIRDIVAAINICTSARWAKMRQEALEKDGRGAEFRIEKCAYCKAIIDATGHPETLQVYCPFCDAVVTQEGRAPSDEAKYRLCDECGFYAQPKDFTVFYFVFAFVIYYFSHRTIHVCNACMKGEAWKMWFANLIFILGFPFAVVQLFRAYLGGSTFSTAFTGLDIANGHARKGRAHKAGPMYTKIEERLPTCAGVRYNHGRVLLAVGRTDDAAGKFRKSLDDCSNYTPAFEGLCACLEELDRTQELTDLKKEWGEEAE